MEKYGWAFPEEEANTTLMSFLNIATCLNKIRIQLSLFKCKTKSECINCCSIYWSVNYMLLHIFWKKHALLTLKTWDGIIQQRKEKINNR